MMFVLAIRMFIKTLMSCIRADLNTIGSVTNSQNSWSLRLVAGLTSQVSFADLHIFPVFHREQPKSFLRQQTPANLNCL